MTDNYRAWEVNFDDFYLLDDERDKLQFLLKFAILAPSSHNSQPWKFKIDGNNILILPDFSRSLPESDKNNRQLFTSLGCALENLLQAGDYFGYQTEYSIEKSADEINYFIRVRIEESPSAEQNSPNHLASFITKRVTSRHEHIFGEINTSFIDKLSKKYGDNLKIDLIDNQDKKLKIADIVIKAGVGAMEDKGFRRELSQYVKNNTTCSYTGMPCFGMNIPTPISYFAPTTLRFFNMNKLSEKSDRKLLEKQTQYMVVISTKEDTPTDWIKVGQIYQNLSLQALAQGIYTSPMAAPIQIGEYYKDLQNALGTIFRPQFFCRLGKIKKPTHHSPRIPAEKIITSE